MLLQRAIERELARLDALVETLRELADGILAVKRHEIRQRREQSRVGHLLRSHAALGALVPGSENEAQRSKAPDPQNC